MARKENDRHGVANLFAGREMQDGADGQTHLCVTLV
jgi:hypothetical protein